MGPIKEAIVLAGGFGTRLKSVVKDLPKPLAEVSGRPFLHYVLDNLREGGIEKALLSVGYMHNRVIDAIGTEFKGMEIDYVIEDTPLGTGGAIREALKFAVSKDVVVVNGDSILLGALGPMSWFHHEEMAALTIAVKLVPDAARYGSVAVNGGRLSGFAEKDNKGPGYINTGVYIIDRRRAGVMDVQLDSFSFERDFLMKGPRDVFAYATDAYFIDIGVPEDYLRAQDELVLKCCN
ncbi:MAG: nucleotidyltransferase family protein [Deltaproteobacteria bacterium]|nr:nucleotidyltransferase family protein [Deltaproteobacteria bacterium]